MTSQEAVELRAISSTDVADVGSFLHNNLNSRVSASAWASAIVPPWHVESPNHGFLLACEGGIVGVYLAFYSQREINDKHERFCNLAAWCVLDDFRAHGLRLLRALVGQRGYTFTDLSPSGNVIALNQKLRFTSLNTATALVVNVPWPVKGVRIRTEESDIERVLQGQDMEIFRDHRRTAAARHLVVSRGDEYCYVIFRKDRRKGLPLFASLLYVSNSGLFKETSRVVFSHLLLRHRIPATLVELRIAGSRPPMSPMLSSPRTKMYKGSNVAADQIDYLYSELTCVSW